MTRTQWHASTDPLTLLQRRPSTVFRRYAVLHAFARHLGQDTDGIDAFAGNPVECLLVAGDMLRTAPEEREKLAGLVRCVIPFRRPKAAWRSPTVLAIAKGIYAERAFDRLPILADALEDAGCDDAGLLAHCRGPGPHCRGCFAVDLCLGKS